MPDFLRNSKLSKHMGQRRKGKQITPAINGLSQNTEQHNCLTVSATKMIDITHPGMRGEDIDSMLPTRARQEGDPTAVETATLLARCGQCIGRTLTFWILDPSLSPYDNLDDDKASPVISSQRDVLGHVKELQKSRLADGSEFYRSWLAASDREWDPYFNAGGLIGFAALTRRFMSKHKKSLLLYEKKTNETTPEMSGEQAPSPLTVPHAILSVDYDMGRNEVSAFDSHYDHGLDDLETAEPYLLLPREWLTRAPGSDLHAQVLLSFGQVNG